MSVSSGGLPVTLSRVRLAVQVVMLAVTVYGGAVVGHYMSEMISGALPALSCAYDQSNGAYCVLIPLQHQLHHRVGEAIVRFGTFSIDYLIPMFFTLLSFYAFFVVLNKAFCGWICPLGTVQELISRLGRRLAIPLRSLRAGNTSRVRPFKWLALAVLVLGLPLAAGLGATPHATGDAYCQLCPSRILTTIMTADTEQMAVPTGGWVDFAFAAARNAIFGFVAIAALAIRQPFCRVCPMLALHAVFRRLALLRLVKRPHEDKCGKCGLCTKACPMDIAEVSQRHDRRAFNEDCTLCGRCVEFCPDDDILQLKFGPLPVFKSSSAYFRCRTAMEKPDGTPRRKRARAPGGAHGHA